MSTKKRRRIPGRDRSTASARCPRRACDTLLSQVMGVGGVVAHVCQPCERNKQGLCRDCPAPLPADTHPNKRAPQRLRCSTCTTKHNSKRRKALYHVDVEHHRAVKRRSARQPQVRARQLQRQKDWRIRNKKPHDALDRAYGRTYMRNYRKDETRLEHINRCRRENAARKRAAVVARGEHKRLTPKPFGPRRKTA